MTLGNKIKKLREEQNLTQKDFANLVGVTIGTVAEWEADETAPSLAELPLLSKALGVSSDDLLSETAEEPEALTPNQDAPQAEKSAKKRKALGWFFAVLSLAAIIFLLWYCGIFENLNLFGKGPFSKDTAAIEAADASVVTLFCYDYDGEQAATGSGFVAFDSKTIITNYHVMESAYTCKISTNQDITYEVSEILCYSKEQDIAVLRLAKDTGLQPLTLGDSGTIKKGENVVAIGSPLGIKNTVSTGVLSGRLMESNMDVLQFTAPISSGSSGGALFDDNGNVIGITFASYVNGQNLNLAIPIELAIDLYNTKGEAKSVSAVYTEEHPYVTLLSEYMDVPEITIDELLANPLEYADKTVKLYGYLSSLRSTWYTGFTGEFRESHSCYIAPANNVSGNDEYDYQAYVRAYRGEQPYTIFCILLNEENNYLSPDVEPGDKICLIGEVQAWKGSDGSLTLAPSHGKLVYNLD